MRWGQGKDLILTPKIVSLSKTLLKFSEKKVQHEISVMNLLIEMCSSLKEEAIKY